MNYWQKNKKNIILLIAVVAVIAIELALTLGTYYIMKNDDSNAINKMMVDTNSNMLSYIDLKIKEAIYIIQRNAAFFRMNGIYLSAANYTDMLQNDKFPSKQNIQSYIWIAKISNDSVDYFQNFSREHISSNFTVKEIKLGPNNTFELVQAHGRDYYYPLVFADPPVMETGQDILIGLDFNSFPVIRDIIMIAENPNITSTFRINIFGPKNNNPYSYGIMLNYLSFFDPNTKNISEIFGISSAVVRIGDILDGAINNLDITIHDNDVDIFVFDITNDSYSGNISRNYSLVYKENKEEYSSIWFPFDMANDADGVFRYQYQMASRNWTIYFKYTNIFFDNHNSILLIIVPCVMAGISVLINVLLIILYNLIASLKEKKVLEEKKKNESIQMLRYVNHEVRNPLNVIKGLAQFTLKNIIKMDDGNRSDICIDKKTYDIIVSDLSTVCGSCDMVEHIVTDILDIDKLDSGKLNLNNEWVKIHEFMNDITKTISQKIDEKQTIKLEKIYDKSLVLFFDNYRMKQILLNFLTNSVKYTSSGKITININAEDQSIRFSVTDTGRGIPDEAKGKIFRPFSQTSADDTARYGGIGLGLFLCKMLTERMGGTIGFESVYRKGSTFWVDFPKNVLIPPKPEV